MSFASKWIFSCAVFCLLQARSPLTAAEAPGPSPATFELRRVIQEESTSTNSESLSVMNPRGGPNHLQVAREAILDQRHIKKAEVEKDRISGKDQVRVTLSPEGAKLFSKATRENIKKQLAIVVGGKIVAAPVIEQEISMGVLLFRGNISAEEIREIANKLSPHD